MTGSRIKLLAQPLFSQPWLWSFVGAVAVWLAAITYTGGYGEIGRASCRERV